MFEAFRWMIDECVDHTNGLNVFILEIVPLFSGKNMHKSDKILEHLKNY